MQLPNAPNSCEIFFSNPFAESIAEFAPQLSEASAGYKRAKDGHALEYLLDDSRVPDVVAGPPDFARVNQRRCSA
jgi:hypothetical protein